MSLPQLKPSFTNQAVPAALYPYRRGRVYAVLGLLLLLGVMVALATTVGSVQIPFLTTSSIIP